MKDYKGLFEMPRWYLNKLWPNLSDTNFELTSEVTSRYNCVAWAVGNDKEVIDLSLDEDEEPILYPDLTCLTYIEYFEKEGFELCETPDWEADYEKIALFEKDGKTFEHVARQIQENLWTSKLGEWEDIEHISLEALKSQGYGVPAWYMRRLKI